jgi:mRNA interferase RelE/StbE
MKEIAFTSAALRQWVRLSAEVRDRINGRLEAYARNGQGDVRKLTGRAGLRLRVGDWRVIFFENKQTLTIVAVGHRREIYD